jgi:glucosamine kinase
VQALRQTELKQVVYNAFCGFFKFAKVSVGHDIDAAAIACCRNTPGIVSICASGSQTRHGTMAKR